jgi:hypothetical protein
MDSMTRRALLGALIMVLGVAALGGALATPGSIEAQQPAPTEVPVLGKIQAENACYVRLPDLPLTPQKSGRYGLFGAYNPQTGVIAAAGGAHKMSSENTIAYHDLLAFKMDGSMPAWREVPYSQSAGYTQETDKGCREMASVQLSDTNWVSAWGKDGCDNGAFDTKSQKGGDLKELQVLDSASPTGVKWVPNSGASQLIGKLEDSSGKLYREFAAWDSQRNRLVFGQGTFDDEKDVESQDRVYEAKKVGSKFQLVELKPTGSAPVKRYGTCAAYIYDQVAGVDGVLVLGGQEGAPAGVPATTYKEVWWLDFSKGKNGEWSQITDRFGNMDAIGYRREGACAYDPDTKYFYSWMGRADSKIPDGAKHSAGAWRVDLAQLADTNATLTWERLAKDNLEGINGRRLIPSVWDPVKKRMFVIGGRLDDDGLPDVWAIYPGVTGAECTNLNPYEQPPAPPTNTPRPTNTPGGPTPQPTTAVPPQPTVAPGSCSFIVGRVPAQVINDALANPTSIQGYGQLQNPGVPESPYNVRRTKLSLRNISAPYHPLYNGLIYKAGCP